MHIYSWIFTKIKAKQKQPIRPWFVGDSVYHSVVLVSSSPLVEFHPFDAMPWALPCEPKCAAKIDTNSHSQCVHNIGKTVEWNVCNTIINQTLNYPRSNSSMPTQFRSIFVFSFRYSCIECVSIHLSSTKCATVTLQLYHICSHSVSRIPCSRSAHVHFSFPSHSMAESTVKWTLRTGLKACEVAYVESHWYRNGSVVFPMRNTEWTQFAWPKRSFASNEFNLKSLAQFSVRENGYFMPFGDSVWVQLYSNQHRQLFCARIFDPQKEKTWNGHRVRGSVWK